MLKKSLIFGSIVLLLAMVFALAGCNNPAGPEGPPGKDSIVEGPQGNKGPEGIPEAYIGGSAGGDVYPLDLTKAFEKSEMVVLLSSVTSVSGTVKAGTTLYVLGKVGVGVGGVHTGKLVIEDGATINIWSDTSRLTATGNGTSGLLVPAKGASVTIEGKGEIFLPIITYPFDDVPDPIPYNDGLHYDSQELVNFTAKYPGSAIASPTSSPSAFNSAAIFSFFTNRSTKNRLEILTVDGSLTANAIPSEKTLVLRGNDTEKTTISANFDLTADATLIVEKTGELDINGTSIIFQAKGANSAFINKGTVTLSGSSTINTVTTNLGVITNDGVIGGASTAINPALLEALLKLNGTGAIAPDVDVTLTTSTELRQNLEIPATKTITAPAGDKLFYEFTAGKTITIKGTLDLKAVKTIGDGVKVVNEGLIKTDTVSSTVLTTIFNSMDKTGKVQATANVLLDADFEIPEKTELIANAATLGGAAHDLTIKGSLSATGIALAPQGNVTVNGTLYLEQVTSVGSLTILPAKELIIPSSSTVDIDGDGLITASQVSIDGSGNTAPPQYYTAANLVAANFKEALTDIRATIVQLSSEPQVTAAPEYGVSGKVAGVAILLDDTTAAPITTRADGVNVAGLTDKVRVKDGVVVAATQYSVDVSKFGDAQTFELTTDITDWYLKITDSAHSGSKNQWGIVTFTAFTVARSNLTSPASTERILIAVRSTRP
jgi:hypothetical protein